MKFFSCTFLPSTYTVLKEMYVPVSAHLQLKCVLVYGLSPQCVACIFLYSILMTKFKILGSKVVAVRGQGPFPVEMWCGYLKGQYQRCLWLWIILWWICLWLWNIWLVVGKWTKPDTFLKLDSHTHTENYKSICENKNTVHGFYKCSGYDIISWLC